MFVAAFDEHVTWGEGARFRRADRRVLIPVLGAACIGAGELSEGPEKKLRDPSKLLGSGSSSGPSNLHGTRKTNAERTRTKRTTKHVPPGLAPSLPRFTFFVGLRQGQTHEASHYRQ